MKYEALCIDIDGTLLDDNKKMLPQVKNSLRDVAKKGIPIILASGRMPAGVDPIERELGVQCVKVCNAGTYILMGDRCINAEYLLSEVMKNIYIEIAKKNNVPLWIFQEKKWFVTSIDKYVEREIEIIQYHPETVDAEHLADQWSREGIGPNKLLIAAEPKLLELIYHQIKERTWLDVDVACSSSTLLEIFPKGVNKGTALITVCNKLNLDIRNVVAFGDHELDIPMLEAAGIGVAMGNAIGKLKEEADFVTKTNNEAGISYALEHYLAE